MPSEDASVIFSFLLFGRPNDVFDALGPKEVFDSVFEIAKHHHRLSFDRCPTAEFLFDRFGEGRKLRESEVGVLDLHHCLSTATRSLAAKDGSLHFKGWGGTR